jgi:hypothetical protein
MRTNLALLILGLSGAACGGGRTTTAVVPIPKPMPATFFAQWKAGAVKSGCTVFSENNAPMFLALKCKDGSYALLNTDTGSSLQCDTTPPISKAQCVERSDAMFAAGATPAATSPAP